MNNRNRKNRSIFEKRGFYTALYSCIGVVLVLAVGITYNTLNRDSIDILNMNNRQNIAPETNVPVIPRAAHEDNFTMDGINVAEGSIRDILPSLPRQNVPPAEDSPAPPAPPSEPPVEATQPQPPAPPVLPPTPPPPPPQAEAALVPVPEVVPVLMPIEADFTRDDEEYRASDGETVYWDDDPVAYEGFIADPVFSVFTGNENMGWPVRGEIVMGFSVDRLIHDVTLNQFRTNDKISISANIGTQVRAASDGVVRSVTNDRRLGNTVVIEHGNGWFTTYSQLQDHILVEEGDVVTKDQVIGGVGEPSIFYTLLGSHLSFRVTRDGTAVNPLIVLGN